MFLGVECNSIIMLISTEQRESVLEKETSLLFRFDKKEAQSYPVAMARVGDGEGISVDEIRRQGFLENMKTSNSMKFRVTVYPNLRQTLEIDLEGFREAFESHVEPSCKT